MDANLHDIIRRELDISDRVAITGSSHLETLSPGNSRVPLLYALQRHYGITIEPEEIMQLRTVDEVGTFIVSKQAAQTRSRPVSTPGFGLFASHGSGPRRF